VDALDSSDRLPGGQGAGGTRTATTATGQRRTQTPQMTGDGGLALSGGPCAGVVQRRLHCACVMNDTYHLRWRRHEGALRHTLWTVGFYLTYGSGAARAHVDSRTLKPCGRGVRGAGGAGAGCGGCVVQLAAWLLHNNMYRGFGYVRVYACCYPAGIDRGASTYTILRVRVSRALRVKCQAVCVGKPRAHSWQQVVFEGPVGRRVLNVASCIWGHLKCMGRQRGTNE
jgi:hypothetical protein